MKKLQVLPPKNVGGVFTGKPAVHVNWDDFLNDEPWLATKGIDFHCTIRTFASRVYQAAKRKNKRVIVRITETAVAFQTIPSKCVDTAN